MENEPTENYINIILEGLANNYPSPFILLYFFPPEYHTNNALVRKKVYEAQDILIEKGMIVKSGGSIHYKATPLGLEVCRNGGYTKYKEKIEADKLREAETKQLTYEKLIEDLKKVKADNRYFKWVAVAALGLTLFQLILKMFGR